LDSDPGTVVEAFVDARAPAVPTPFH